MLMKITSKCKHKVREHDNISINKTKHGKTLQTKQNTNANKGNGGSVFTAIGFSNLIVLQKETRDLIPLFYP